MIQDDRAEVRLVSGSVVRAAAVALASAALLGAACTPGCGMLQASPTSPGSPAVHWHPSPSDPNTWPDACRMLTQRQLSTVLPGSFIQTRPGSNLPHPSICRYSQPRGDHYLAVQVAILAVEPPTVAHQEFSAGRTEFPSSSEAIGDEAYYGLSGVVVHQGTTLWEVSIYPAPVTAPNLWRGQEERLARIIAPEFGS